MTGWTTAVGNCVEIWPKVSIWEKASGNRYDTIKIPHACLDPALLRLFQRSDTAPDRIRFKMTDMSNKWMDIRTIQHTCIRVNLRNAYVTTTTK